LRPACRLAAQRAVGFSGIVSIGDQLDVDIADLLDYFALDEKTQAILLYIEAIKDARKFMSAARAAARVKRSWSSSQAEWRRAPRLLRPIPEHWQVRTPSTMPHSSAPAFCGYLIFVSCSTAPRRSGESNRRPGNGCDPDQWRRYRRAGRRPAG